MKDLAYRMLRYTLSFYSPEIRYDIASEICGGMAKYVPGDMLHTIKKRYGLFTSLYSDVILFGWCFAVCPKAGLYLLFVFLPRVVDADGGLSSCF